MATAGLFLAVVLVAGLCGYGIVSLLLPEEYRDEFQRKLGELREAAPNVAVVCLTASANLREVDALYEAGAVACLSKDQELDEIVEAIRRAA